MRVLCRQVAVTLILITASSNPAASAKLFSARMSNYGVTPEHIQIIDITVQNGAKQAAAVQNRRIFDRRAQHEHGSPCVEQEKSTLRDVRRRAMTYGTSSRSYSAKH